MRVYAADDKAQLLVCLDFDPTRGFTKRWSQPQEMLCFLSLFGDAANWQIVGTNYNSSYGDQVVWLDAAPAQAMVRYWSFNVYSIRFTNASTRRRSSF